ncbi:DUF2218 domain-containing protein [Zobellella sp. An-6]|uniref:DUF2218 domain-containing protein n=1 Tax=Zobellella sp. An-6 TaxID=3400218 RepID=UPI0040432DB6
MADCLARIATPHGEGYIKKLCIHFRHKVEADWQDRQGWVQFAMGRCELNAGAGHLEVRCTAATPADLAAVADTMKSHFDRFAVRDGLVLSWI